MNFSATQRAAAAPFSTTHGKGKIPTKTYLVGAYVIYPKQLALSVIFAFYIVSGKLYIAPRIIKWKVSQLFEGGPSGEIQTCTQKDAFTTYMPKYICFNIPGNSKNLKKI